MFLLNRYARALGVVMMMMLCSTVHVQAGDAPDVQNLFEKRQGPLPYRLLMPLDYDPACSYPLVLFLHGAGERGCDNEKQLWYFVDAFVQPAAREQFPCFVVAPQCPEDEWWSDLKDLSAPSKAMTGALAILGEVDGEFNIDRSRVYISGLSMGGFGTWDAVARYPRLFAAAVPICAQSVVEWAPSIAPVPVWAFHGAVDHAVPVQCSRDMVQALKDAGATPRYTEYPDVDHDSWTPASRDPELLPWLFAQVTSQVEWPLLPRRIQAGERVIFFGDSITRRGSEPGGYVDLLAERIGLDRPADQIEVVGSGVGGNKVGDLLDRVKEDVLSRKPTLVVVFIGVNDVWHWEAEVGGTSPQAFRAGLTKLVEKIRGAGADVILCTPSLIGEKKGLGNRWDVMLNDYAQIGREVAAQSGVGLIDLRRYFKRYEELYNTQDTESGLLTIDRVHLSDKGNRYLANLMSLALQGVLPSLDNLGEARVWADLRTVGLMEGLGWPGQGEPYDRLPARAEEVVRPMVWNLSRHSAGVAARFTSSSPYLFMRWRLLHSSAEALAMPHMPATGVSGIDLYARNEAGQWRYQAGGYPVFTNDTYYPVARMHYACEPADPAREYMLYLPLYNGVRWFEVGVALDQALPTAADPRPQALERPIVFYGTSITQGGCASRPGMPAVAQVGRLLDRPVINLGFSGNAWMDFEVARLLAELDPQLYVIDSLANMNEKMVEERAETFLGILRAAHPATPIVVVEDSQYADRLPTERGAAMRRIVERLAQDDPRIYFMPANGMLGEDSEATVDSVHLTDLGYARQTECFVRFLTPLLEGAKP